MNVALTGGGSYLVDGIQSTGISFGLEPLFLTSKIEPDKNNVLILSLSQDAKAIALSQTLRENRIPVILLTDKSPSKALDYANTKKIKNVIIIGEEEIKNKKYTFKNMETGKEEKLTEKEILEKISF